MKKTLTILLTFFALQVNGQSTMGSFVSITPPACYFDSAIISAYIVGGVPPYQYKWTRKINGVTTIVQDFQNAPLTLDYILDENDQYGVDLLTSQAPMGSGSVLFKLTVLDSHIENLTPGHLDEHDTLITDVTVTWPTQISYPNITEVIPSCDTCADGHLFITPLNGTSPYNILFIGTDNYGNHVEYFGEHCSGMAITNLAELHVGCYDIYITDYNGCHEVFNYCFTTTSLSELTKVKKRLKVFDLYGNIIQPSTGKIMIYEYSDGSREKVFISE
ncbi:MAG: hypothetical protein ACKOXP_10095 [Flavobacteriales bacterium]